MSKAKILLIIKVPPPITGATKMNLAVRDSYLVNSSFNIKPINISYAVSIEDIGTYRIKKLVLAVNYFFQLLNNLVKFKPALVYFQLSHQDITFLRDFFLVVLIKLFRVKIVYHLHGKGIKSYSENKFYRFLYRMTFKNESVVILSELLRYDIECVHWGKIFVVPNGIPDIPDIDFSFPASQDVYKPLGLLFLSNLLYSKGILDFITTIELLVQRDINIKALIVGAEADLTTLKLNEILSTKNLAQKVAYLGAKYDIEKTKILLQSDVLIYPTLEDIWGNVNLEAMQLAKPVIATDEGAITEIIDDGVTGFIVDKNRPDQIADKVEILYHNRELLNKMGMAGRKKYEEKYTLDIFERNMKNIFEKVIEEINGESNV